MLILACTGRREPGSMGVVQRFIEREPQEPFRRVSMVRGVPVFDWRLAEHEVLADWLAPRPPRRIVLDGVPVELAWEDDRVKISRAADFDAAAIDRIEVVIASRVPRVTRTGEVALYWAGLGEELSGSRQLLARAGELVGEDRRRYRLWVGGEPAWTGRIARLQLICVLPQQVRIQVLGIVGFEETVIEERLAELAHTGVQVAIGEQARNALPGLPGQTIERELEIPRGAELRFAYGLQAGVRVPVRFRVSAVVDGEPRRLFEAGLDPGAEPPRWYEAAVGLGAVAGRRVRLVLETEAGEGLDPARGLPLWGHPEVLAPRQ